ncbi:beta family protein [Escherichia coli]|uniref:beta family protein n=1 Tax=Escherichia coli TaxID=562 RepID=UPI00180DAF5B|nr:beta family protein [Escherichia coli]EFH5191351.1 beta family protein [Escherichia coli]EFN6166600.1 beta family protein [Escherichia coli]EFO9052270.1 beta family protein [Escherichia coli]EHC4966778.1 beta family protein [Escherichia coli]EHP5205923.1 beta family protein [Escherichia coli]
MSNFTYFPIMKTRDAELKAMTHLKDDVFDKILPIYELTKSRKTKTTPDGDIHRRMKELKEIQKGRPFILDICINENYMNAQLEQLLSPDNGYFEWQYFINTYNDLNIIPMVHIDDNDSLHNMESFILSQSKKGRSIAARFPININNIDEYIKIITSTMTVNQKLFIILDSEQITESNIDEVIANLQLNMAKIKPILNENINAIIAGTSFPKTVADYGDKEGDIPIFEEYIYEKFQEPYVLYGDYASINIEQIEIKGGTFVPRIDVSLENIIFYKRYRRNAGSYQKCAEYILKDKRYAAMDIWPDKEIAKAKGNEPSGISPSFWISVRMNHFMNTRVKLRSKG